MKDTSETPQKPLPNVYEDELTGNVTVTNFEVKRGQYIDIEFRGMTGADDAFIRRTMAADDEKAEVSSDWLILTRMCVRWGSDTSVTSGEFIAESMPYTSLRLLRRKVIPLLFRTADTDE